MNDTKICPECQTENPTEANFCRHCGKPFVNKNCGTRPLPLNKAYKEVRQPATSSAIVQSIPHKHSNVDSLLQERLRKRSSEKSDKPSSVNASHKEPNHGTANTAKPLFWRVFFRLLAFSISFCFIFYVYTIEDYNSDWWILGFAVLSSWTFSLIACVIIEIKKDKSLDKELSPSLLYILLGTVVGFIAYWLQ